MNPILANQKNSDDNSILKSVNRYRNIQLPSVFNEDLLFSIADNKKDLGDAYSLVYKEYLKEGYTSPKDHGLYVNKYNAHPLSTTFIGKYKGKVIITMTIYVDSEIGLPMDVLYKEELNALRKENRLLVEVGSFASSSDHRMNDQILPVLLNNIMQRYTNLHLKADDLVITVNPKHVLFYTKALLFEKIGKTKDYSTVNNHPAVLLRSNLNTFEKNLRNLYQNSPKQCNIHDFFFTRKISNFKLPEDQQIISTYNEELFTHFFKEKTEIGKSLTPEEEQKILSVYRQFEMFKNLKTA